MCRLTAITTTDLPGDLRTSIFDRMMLASNADDGQHDGHGIAVQSGIIWKSQYPYWSTEPDYLSNLDLRVGDNIVIGHVRKASPGTDKFSALAAHPYVFFVDERPLLIAHNGFIDGTPRAAWNSNEPNTDTYRAAKVLVSMFQAHIRLTGSHDLSNDLLEAWMQTFYKSSVYVIFLLWDNELIILRGNAHRTMYLTKVGNGYIFNTSRDVIDVTAARLKQFGVSVDDTVHYLAEYTISRSRAGTHELNIASYVPEYDDWPRTTYPNSNSHGASGNGSSAGRVTPPASSATPPASSATPNVTAPPSTAIVLPVGDEERLRRNLLARLESDEYAYDDELYIPRSGSAARRPRRNAHGNNDAARREVMAYIRGQLNPMRSSTIFYWIAEIFGLKNTKGEIALDAVINLQLQDLQDFVDYMAPAMSKSDENPKKMFSPKQKQIINLWNRLVPVERDREILTRFTRSWDYFWLKTDVELAVIERYIQSLLNSRPHDVDPFSIEEVITPAAA